MPTTQEWKDRYVMVADWAAARAAEAARNGDDLGLACAAFAAELAASEVFMPSDYMVSTFDDGGVPITAEAAAAIAYDARKALSYRSATLQVSK